MYGQGYDGASNMLGRFKGTQKIVREHVLRPCMFIAQHTR